MSVCLSVCLSAVVVAEFLTTSYGRFESKWAQCRPMTPDKWQGKDELRLQRCSAAAESSTV